MTVDNTLDKDKIVLALQQDVKDAAPYHDEWETRRKQWIREFNGEKYGNEPPVDKRTGNPIKASVVSRDIKKAASWQHAAIIDPFVSSPNMVRCHPVTAEDKSRAEQDETLLNYQFCRNFDRYNFISNGFKIFQREGTVIAKVGWIFEEEEQLVDVPVIEYVPVQNPDTLEISMQPQQVGVQKQSQMVTIKNQPTAVLYDNAMVYIDPTCKDTIANAKFIAIKYKSSLSDLKSEGIYENLAKVANTLSEKQDWSSKTYNYTDDNFVFSDVARKEIDVVEYWGYYDIDGDDITESIVVTWVGDQYIRFEESPFPSGDLPFVQTAYDAEPLSINGIPNGDIISTDQKIRTGFKRAVLDTLNSSTNGQKGVKQQSLDPINLKLFKDKQDFEFQGNSVDIWEGKFNEIPASLLNYDMLISNEIESLTGVKSFTGGIGASKMGDSATAARGILDATAKREIDISRNFKENFIIPILRKWLEMNALYMEKEQVERITNKPYIDPIPNDLDANIDIDLDISTAETDASKSRELSFMLQTMAQSLPFDLTKILLAEQAKLQRMPQLSEQILQYQPQPNPLEQEKAQLEIEKLKAEIEERKSRAMENQVDMKLKEANATLAAAKARDLHSTADQKDLDFVKDQDGTKRTEDLQDQMLEYNKEKDLKQVITNRPLS